MGTGHLQMWVFSALVTLLTVGGLAYIFITQPAYLRSDRDGVPYFSPKVENPVTGEAMEMGTLVRHYRGETP